MQQTKSTPAEKTFQLHIKGNDICVNGIGVIETQSKSGRIFFIFLDQFFMTLKWISPEHTNFKVGELQSFEKLSECGNNKLLKHNKMRMAKNYSREIGYNFRFKCQKRRYYFNFCQGQG
ncbi:putative phage related protein [Wolbachia endosymbiont of Culex quinquefasciatus JHB]|nr:putative phage related protein [Wolbachia endosymbiont of Culex quinquefasciatus JHB]